MDVSSNDFVRQFYFKIGFLFYLFKDGGCNRKC